MAEPAAARTVNRFERRRQRSRGAPIDAAIELFQENGVRATRLEEICARADVSARTFFNHFATREALFQAIAAQRVVQITERLDALCDDPRPLAKRLVELFRQIGGYLAARPPYRELVGEMLVLRDGADGEVGRSRQLRGAALRFVRDGVKRGEIAKRHRAEVLADLLLGALTVGIGSWSSDETYDLERGLVDAARALLDLFGTERK
jgi:AcrR family transcriptional regulator